MQLESHEIHDLHELTVSCVNSITNMALFRNMVEDQELRSLIEEHFEAHIQDYNMKVRFIKNSTGANDKLNVPQLNPILNDFINSPTSNFPPITPRTNIQKLNDREIATAYLLTLKRAGREYAWTAMEASNPSLREFFKDAFTMSCNHAYDVWQWMANKGYYPISPAPKYEMDTLVSIYNEVSLVGV